MAKPLGYRTTALDALRGADLSGKVAVVTGEGMNGPRPPMRGPGRAAAAALPPSGPCLLVPPACCDPPAGGNSGIGVETVRALAHAGADVTLCSRSASAGQRVADELQPGVKVRRGQR